MHLSSDFVPTCSMYMTKRLLKKAFVSLDFLMRGNFLSLIMLHDFIALQLMGKNSTVVE